MFFLNDYIQLNHIYTVLGPLGHDIKFDSLKTSITFRRATNIETNDRKSGERKYDCQLPDLDVLTLRVRYCVNGS